MYREQQRVGRNPRDTHKVTFGVVGQFAREQIDGVAGPHQQQHMRIWRCTSHQFGSNYGTAAGTILDNDLLTQHRTHGRRQHATDDIDGATRSERHDKAQLFCRKILCMGGAGEQRATCRAGAETFQAMFHQGSVQPVIAH